MRAALRPVGIHQNRPTRYRGGCPEDNCGRGAVTSAPPATSVPAPLSEGRLDGERWCDPPVLRAGSKWPVRGKHLAAQRQTERIFRRAVDRCRCRRCGARRRSLLACDERDVPLSTYQADKQSAGRRQAVSCSHFALLRAGTREAIATILIAIRAEVSWPLARTDGPRSTVLTSVQNIQRCFRHNRKLGRPRILLA